MDGKERSHMHRRLSLVLALALSLILLASPTALAGQDESGTKPAVPDWRCYGDSSGNPCAHAAPRAIVMASPNDGWAVGDGGLILRWNGAAWSRVTSPTRYDLRGLAAVGPHDLWAVGVHGTILHGDGVQWSNIPSPTTKNLLAVSMASASEGWASVDNGDGLWFLHWNGSIWAPITGTWQSFRANAVVALSPTDAWATTEYALWRWNGNAWAQFPEGSPPYGLAFVSNAYGWGVGRGGMMRHWDGSNWNWDSSGTQEDLVAVTVSSTGEGWAVGARGTIVRRHNGVWSVVASPTTSDLYAVATSPEGMAWASGDNTLLRWDGSSWSSGGYTPLTTKDLNAVAVVPGGNCIAPCANAWAVGYDGTILRHTGAFGVTGSWTVAPSPTGNSLHAVTMVSSNDGWSVGGGGVILRWNGTNWTGAPSLTRQMLYDVDMASPDDGWAVGLGGTILRWNGANWQAVASPVRNDLSALAVVTKDDVWAVGSGPWLAQSVALHWDGKVWLAVPVPGNPSLADVTMSSAREGWAVGTAGAIRHWDGNTWAAVTSPTDDDLLAVDGTSAKDVWATGMHGTLLHWDGATWSIVPSPTTRALFGLAMSPSQRSWAVGWGGVILETVVPTLDVTHTAGATGSYFNVTGSNFPASSEVKIDVNGHYLGTVQVTAPGTFAVTLDTREASSGYYRLTTPQISSIAAWFRLDPADPIWPREGEHPVWTIPAGIEARMLYLPCILR